MAEVVAGAAAGPIADGVVHEAEQFLDPIVSRAGRETERLIFGEEEHHGTTPPAGGGGAGAPNITINVQGGNATATGGTATGTGGTGMGGTGMGGAGGT